MGTSSRHYKALMKKNCINWKRTPCGSCCELICPILLMLIILLARDMIDPTYQDDQSFYSLRRPFYPIAKPELDDRFAFSMADQQRQLENYRDFFDYMDGQNMNVTVPVNVTYAVEVVSEVVSEITGAPNVVEIAVELKNDIRYLTNLTALIENTPLANFTENINWDGIEDLIGRLGLENVIKIEELKEFTEEIQERIVNPNLLIKDLFDIDLQATVDKFLDDLPNVQEIIDQYEIIDINLDGYLPITDPYGPFFFLPKHCYPEGKDGKDIRSVTKYNSNVIAYVKTGSSVENDMVDQMTSLFAFQKTIFAEIATLNVLGLTKNYLNPSQFKNYFREDEMEKFEEKLGSRFGLNGTAAEDYINAFFLNNAAINKNADNFGNFKIKEFDSKSQLDAYISSDQVEYDEDYEQVCFGFSVHENDQKNDYELELFFNDLRPGWLQSIPNQKKPASNAYEYTPQVEDFQLYTAEGFSTLQNWVANTILKRKTGVDTASIVTMIVPLKMPPYTEDDFGRVLQGVFAFFLLIMFIPAVYRTTYRIVNEKESMVKESMKMMGLSDFSYWASWYSYYTIVNSIISLSSWAIFFFGVDTKSSGFIIFLTIWLFGQSLFGIILVAESLFNKARAAAITTTLIYFGSGLFQYFVSDSDIQTLNRICASFSPTVAMIQTTNVLGKFESSQVGSNFDNIFAEFENFSVGYGLLMLLVDNIWILLLGIYLDQIMPRKFGSRKSPCFIFMCCKKNDNQIINVDINDDTDKSGSVEQTMAFETANMNKDCYEMLNSEIEPKEIEHNLLKVQGLHKTYPNGFKAVNGINVKMYTDQIFCLLGHNGAGKSTTISCLTGLINSTQGQASLFGQDLFKKMGEARKNMGVCPQHNVLFDLLTPKEHLEIFYDFKGGEKAIKNQEIEKILHDIGVADKKNSIASQLSGGNKRKLSVAIALCGNSKFVLLDEPTSGLDIQARRQLWNMLRAYKKDRIILLTTHYMDEADILGDRIGIMTQGKMTCLGSSMFLKSRFGVGYVMTIVKNNPAPSKTIMPYLKDRLGPQVVQLTEIQSEMTVQIPKEYTELFKDFFTDFDDDLQELEIQNYGVAVTTLEQVFLEIGHNPDPKPKITMELISQNDEQNDDSRPVTPTIDPDNMTQGSPKKSSKYNKIHPIDNFQTVSVPQKVPQKAPQDINDLNGTAENVLDSSQRGLLAQQAQSSELVTPGQISELVVPQQNAEGGPKPFFPDISGSKMSGYVHDSGFKEIIGDDGNQIHNSVSLSDNEDVQSQDPQTEGKITLVKKRTPKSEFFTETPKPETPFDDKNQDMEMQGVSNGNNEKTFALERANLKDDNSFCNNFAAVLNKRFYNDWRQKKRICFEIVLPSIFMLFGIWLSTLDFQYRSDDLLLTPSLYPLKQKLLVNAEVYDIKTTNVSPVSEFIASLPDQNDSFDVTYTRQRGATFDDFADEVFKFGTKESISGSYLYGSYEIFEADTVNQDYKFVSYVNMTSSSSAALFPQFMYESILKVATGDPDFQFKTRSTPYPLTHQLERIANTNDAGQVIFFTSIAYSVLITITVSYLVAERVSQLKHVQEISGMRLTSYWLTNFIIDSLKLYVTIAVTIVSFELFDLQYDTARWVFLLFPFGILPFTYVTSFLFTEESAAQTFTMFFHMAVILAFSSTIFILRFVPSVEVIGDQMHYAIRAIPSYSLATSLYVDSSIEFISQIRKSTDGEGEDISSDPWDFKNNTLDIMLMGGHFFFWFFILFLIEADLGKRLRKCYNTICCLLRPKAKLQLKVDDDVTAEAERIDKTPDGELQIKVKNLRKVYGLKGSCCTGAKSIVAVDDLSFGLNSGECFALLGVNGAGKSTTFKTLTSEIEATSGDIKFGSYDIKKDFNKIKKMIGYCPQTNPVFDYMTVSENIDYFARIKGIPIEDRNNLVNQTIRQLALDPHRSKLAGNLSGGNKRKLSVALAIVGSPPIILLDEPSAGMDPEARRFMWRVIEQIQRDKTSAIILTTHSMEEAEALSTKMGIMIKGGTFKCFGTSQHIKDKFDTGYIVEIKAQMPIQEEIDEVRDGVLAIEGINDEELKKALQRPTLTTEEASKILTEAQVPGILIESILRLDQHHVDSELNEEEVAAQLLKTQFTLNEIASEIFVKGALFGVIEEMCHEFVNVEILEQYGSYMKLRVERNDHTVGFLFRLIEELKEEHQLEDYLVGQTTLEQIFQGIADNKFDENVPTYCIDEESGELAKIIFEEPEDD